MKSAAAAEGGDRAVDGEPEDADREVVANFWQNFGKKLLVFGCIGTEFCKKICVLQHFSKSTRLSYLAEIFEMWEYFANFATFHICKNLLNFHKNC